MKQYCFAISVVALVLLFASTADAQCKYVDFKEPFYTEAHLFSTKPEEMAAKEECLHTPDKYTVTALKLSTTELDAITEDMFNTADLPVKKQIEEFQKKAITTADDSQVNAFLVQTSSATYYLYRKDTKWAKIVDTNIKAFACALRIVMMKRILKQIAHSLPEASRGNLLSSHCGTAGFGSDVDLAINGLGSEPICGDFNKRFKKSFGQTSATSFDVNVYCTNYILPNSLLKDKTSAYAALLPLKKGETVPEPQVASLIKCVNQDEKLALMDADSQHAFAFVKLFIFGGVSNILGIFDTLFKSKGFPAKSEATKNWVNNILEQAYEIYDTNLNFVYEEGIKFTDISNEKVIRKRNRMFDFVLRSCQPFTEYLYKLNLADKESPSFCAEARKCFARSNFFAMEAYLTYGPIADVVIAQQSGLLDPAEISVNQYLDSFVENWADCNKEFDHLMHEKEVTLPEIVLTIGKYLYRLLYALDRFKAPKTDPILPTEKASIEKLCVSSTSETKEKDTAINNPKWNAIEATYMVYYCKKKNRVVAEMAANIAVQMLQELGYVQKSIELPKKDEVFKALEPQAIASFVRYFNFKIAHEFLSVALTIERPEAVVKTDHVAVRTGDTPVVENTITWATFSGDKDEVVAANPGMFAAFKNTFSTYATAVVGSVRGASTTAINAARRLIGWQFKEERNVLGPMFR